MVSPEKTQTDSVSVEPISSPRISFSSDFLDETNFIPSIKTSQEQEKPREKTFEFLSSNNHAMLPADELFFEGKLLPYWQMHHEIKKITLRSEEGPKAKSKVEDLNLSKESRGSWFIDDDPSPRPPSCTVLWKELLRLRKQRPSTLSPSSSSSSSSSAGSLVDSQGTDKEDRSGNKDKYAKKSKKGLERTRSATMRIRPVVNVPICTQGKNSALPPLFSFKKGKPEKLK
ncbi:Chromatin remodeling 8 [Heracleum sosnowskyi]|uniref:Chromatin remodeling 8 n=1 Tax=Heracleum sosnowskyi TaxID=360622 RepID=A0AAD8IN36_9APIA|nr:Chromatin remodeling 8 [Heracleum sosnowskyi]